MCSKNLGDFLFKFGMIFSPLGDVWATFESTIWRFLVGASGNPAFVELLLSISFSLLFFLRFLSCRFR